MTLRRTWNGTSGGSGHVVSAWTNDEHAHAVVLPPMGPKMGNVLVTQACCMPGMAQVPQVARRMSTKMQTVDKTATQSSIALYDTGWYAGPPSASDSAFFFFTAFFVVFPVPFPFKPVFAAAFVSDDARLPAAVVASASSNSIASMRARVAS